MAGQMMSFEEKQRMVQSFIETIYTVVRYD
jgi:hypothetical protein